MGGPGGTRKASRFANRPSWPGGVAARSRKFAKQPRARADGVVGQAPEFSGAFMEIQTREATKVSRRRGGRASSRILRGIHGDPDSRSNQGLAQTGWWGKLQNLS